MYTTAQSAAEQLTARPERRVGLPQLAARPRTDARNGMIQMTENTGLAHVRAELNRLKVSSKSIVEDEHNDPYGNIGDLGFWIEHHNGSRVRLDLSRREIDDCHNGITKSVEQKMSEAF